MADKLPFVTKTDIFRPKIYLSHKKITRVALGLLGTFSMCALELDVQKSRLHHYKRQINKQLRKRMDISDFVYIFVLRYNH